MSAMNGEPDVKPTDLAPPSPPGGALDGTSLEAPGQGDAIDLNVMIAMARLIAAGHRVKARIPTEVMIRSLAATIVKLVDDGVHEPPRPARPEKTIPPLVASKKG